MWALGAGASSTDSETFERRETSYQHQLKRASARIESLRSELEQSSVPRKADANQAETSPEEPETGRMRTDKQPTE
jgi:hypothetical protein